MKKANINESFFNNFLLFLALTSVTFLLSILFIHFALPHQNLFNMLFEPCLRECFKLFTLTKKIFLSFKNLLALTLLWLFARAVLKSLSQFFRARKYSLSLYKVPLPQSMKNILKKLSIKESQVVLFASGLSLAFTSGILYPKIFLSTELIKSLPDQELMAVLLHEESHRRRKDPFRGLVIYFFSNWLLFIPALRKIYAAFQKSSEFIADSFAVQSSVSQFTLASALLNVRKRNVAIIKSMADFSIADFEFERVQRLVYGEKGISPRNYHLGDMAKCILIAFVLIAAIFPQERFFGKRPHTLCNISEPRLQTVDKLHAKPFIAIHHSGGNHEN